ncbi:hypothetical protein [Thiocystis violacea]|uniref:hypothetical protein n=1 Tax=Thiocystis violacea TaxID=13725 RepID=UPI001F5B1EF3|nr:hypothetical protein [Thiocystis violacea]
MSRFKSAASWSTLASCLLLGLVYASCAVGDVPDPLGLEQALRSLDDHSGSTASADMRVPVSRRPPLYLDCQQLAFASGSGAEAESDAGLRALLKPAAAQRLEVVERFFDVLLADFSFSSESEAMAVAYVQFDRAAARRDLGQLSELRVLELEAVYQDLLHRRTASELSQQLTRSRLARALGHPEDLPRTLADPVLPALPEPLPTTDDWLKAALEAERLVMPDPALQPSDLPLFESELRQEITELLLRLKALAAARRSLSVESAWRDLKLDESRTLYELEVTADLGYSMSQQTHARMREQQIQYCQALTWTGLHELVGQPLWIGQTGSP